jgi:hypothetical protein
MAILVRAAPGREPGAPMQGRSYRLAQMMTPMMARLRIARKTRPDFVFAQLKSCQSMRGGSVLW